jgi:hypothetical protein
MNNKKNLSHLAVGGLSISLIALLGAQATHKPGDFPSPPWPPHSHIEVEAPVVSSMTARVSDAVLSGGRVTGFGAIALPQIAVSGSGSADD